MPAIDQLALTCSALLIATSYTMDYAKDGESSTSTGLPDKRQAEQEACKGLTEQEKMLRGEPFS